MTRTRNSRTRTRREVRENKNRKWRETQDAIVRDLRCYNDGFSCALTSPDHHLLSEEDLFCGNLGSKVTAGNHDSIGRIEDLIEPKTRISRTMYSDVALHEKHSQLAFLLYIRWTPTLTRRNARE